MAILTTGNTFSTGQQVLAGSLNAAVNNAAFAAGAIDVATMQFVGTNDQIGIKDSGVSTAKIAALAVTGAKIAETTITPTKLSAGAPAWTTTALNVTNSLDFSPVTTAASGTYARTLFVVTVTMTAHGMVTGNVATLAFSAGTGGTATNGAYPITVTDANTFTITDTASGTITGTPSVSRTNYYGNSTVRGSESVTGNLSVTGNTAITGSATVAGALSVTGALSVAGSEIRQLTAASSQSTGTTSAVSFNDIPSWVKRVTVMLAGVTFTSANDMSVQLGTGTSMTPVYPTTGYNGGTSRLSSGGTNGANSSTGFAIKTDNASAVLSGSMVITKITGNTWVASGVFGLSASTHTAISGGSIALGSALTQLKFATSSGNFTAGTVNIMYE